MMNVACDGPIPAAALPTASVTQTEAAPLLPPPDAAASADTNAIAAQHEADVGAEGAPFDAAASRARFLRIAEELMGRIRYVEGEMKTWQDGLSHHYEVESNQDDRTRALISEALMEQAMSLGNAGFRRWLVEKGVTAEDEGLAWDVRRPAAGGIEMEIDAHGKRNQDGHRLRPVDASIDLDSITQWYTDDELLSLTPYDAVVPLPAKCAAGVPLTPDGLKVLAETVDEVLQVTTPDDGQPSTTAAAATPPSTISVVFYRCRVNDALSVVGLQGGAQVARMMQAHATGGASLDHVHHTSPPSSTTASGGGLVVANSTATATVKGDSKSLAVVINSVLTPFLRDASCLLLQKVNPPPNLVHSRRASLAVAVAVQPPRGGMSTLHARGFVVNGRLVAVECFVPRIDTFSLMDSAEAAGSPVSTTKALSPVLMRSTTVQQGSRGGLNSMPPCLRGRTDTPRHCASAISEAMLQLTRRLIAIPTTQAAAGEGGEEPSRGVGLLSRRSFVVRSIIDVSRAVSPSAGAVDSEAQAVPSLEAHLLCLGGLEPEDYESFTFADLCGLIAVSRQAPGPTSPAVRFSNDLQRLLLGGPTQASPDASTSFPPASSRPRTPHARSTIDDDNAAPRGNSGQQQLLSATSTMPAAAAVEGAHRVSEPVRPPLDSVAQETGNPFTATMEHVTATPPPRPFAGQAAPREVVDTPTAAGGTTNTAVIAFSAAILGAATATVAFWALLRSGVGRK